MANEIQLTIGLNYANGGDTAFIAPTVVSITQNANGRFAGERLITTADTAITFTGITTNGRLLIKNCDANNYVAYGPESGGALVPLGKLMPGQWDTINLYPGAVLRMQANSASCRVQFEHLNA